MFAETVRRFGTVHILVNNAGIQSGAAFADMTLAQWRKVIVVNLDGQFLCARAAVREFLRRGPQPDVSRALGKIICMSSVHQRIPWAFEANYAAVQGRRRAAHAVAWRRSLRQQKIRVNAVAPGAIRTPINRSAWDTPAGDGEASEAHPLRPHRRDRPTSPMPCSSSPPTSPTT